MQQAIVDALKEVPEARLRLLELAREVIGEDSSLDPEKCAFLRKELVEAIYEAQAYSKSTQEVVWALRGLPS